MPRGKPGVEVTLSEHRLLAEWLAEKHPTARVQLQPRLGSVLPEHQNAGLSTGELRLLGNWRRYPDALIFFASSVTIVEASVKPDPGKISLLDLYAHLFPLTPEFQGFASYPLDKLLVVGVPDAAMEVVARAHGVRMELYQPQWVRDELLKLDPRKRRAARIETLPG